jgi:hypothetical protein
MPEAYSHPRLTLRQVEVFHQEGYLLYHEPVLAPDSFAKLKAHFEKKLAELPPDIRPEAMDVPHFADPALFEWLFADEVLDLVEPIIGPDIALFSSHFISKPRGNGRRVPWHEDSAYWKGMMEPLNVVTVWLAIDASTEENGCMRVIPRTHVEGQRGFSSYEPVDATKNVFSSEIVKAHRDDSRAVSCVLQPNQASLHDGRIIHGSNANTSDLRRCGYTMRYMSTACRLSEKAADYHRIYLARGRDLAGQQYADPSDSAQWLIDKRVQAGKKGH